MYYKLNLVSFFQNSSLENHMYAGYLKNNQKDLSPSLVMYTLLILIKCLSYIPIGYYIEAIQIKLLGV